jgi:hypothetical protein
MVSLSYARRTLGKPPHSPYPPDLADGATPVRDFGDLVDAEVANADWANQRAAGFVARRVSFGTPA